MIVGVEFMCCNTISTSIHVADLLKLPPCAFHNYIMKSC